MWVLRFPATALLAMLTSVAQPAGQQREEDASPPLLAILPPAPEDSCGDLRSCSAGYRSSKELPLSVLARVSDSVCEPLLRRGSTLPARATKLFTTTRDNQAVARLELYAGERPFCQGNRYLGFVELAPLPTPSYRSFVQLEVVIEASSDGIIFCHAADVEMRALGEPYCEAEWRGELLAAGGPPPADSPDTEVALFSHALTKHLPVLLATRSVRMFGGRDVVIRQHQRRVEERIGTGGVVWEAAIVLADYVGRNAEAFSWKGKRVLELGAGTGLVAIALALEGADVCATDGNPRVLEGLNANVDGVRPFSGAVRTDVFDWNSEADLRKIQAQGPWDAIVGSDLVYPGNAGRRCVDSNEGKPPADATLLKLLAEIASSTTTVILALKDRTGELERFSAEASKPGRDWSIWRAPAEQIMPEFRSVSQVAVLHLRRKTS
eukprot:TRINITY_DN63858_c0_g1_i1.p1 TRINITY_DN63858_c0_g1~~TRINITY_DN63858_c0_g1_i1.p1  ORF type:complete len:437 (-),score=91.99 TRINITY_DN63858_c0_g1_i1:86-1396(-)